MKSFYSLLLGVILIGMSASAQKAPLKFGKVDIDDLKRTVYDIDTSAEAIMLCHYGEFHPNQFTFTHMYRIKILKEEGKHWANQKFYSDYKGDVRGKTFNLVNGEIVVDKLSNKSIFKEEFYDNDYMINVAMPNVKVGSIIDIEFTHFSLPIIWRFQSTIPVLHSEIRVPQSEYITFQKNAFGYEPLSIIDGNRWVANNMPAFVEEPYINSSENYITKFEFDISEIYFPGFYKSYAKTWENIDKYFDESNLFGVIMRNPNFLFKHIAKEINEKSTSEIERVKLAIDTLHAAMNWNKRCRRVASNLDLKYPFKEREGNSTDINLMLIVLLEKMGFEVYPVVLSTRDNGLLSTFHPSRNKLNYCVAYAKVDGVFYLIDATDDQVPFPLLPKRCLNGQGRILSKEKPGWVDLETKGKNKSVLFFDLQLNEDLVIMGKMSYADYQYAAIDFRKSYSNKDEYLEAFVNKRPGLVIHESEIANIDDIYEPVKRNFEIEITDQCFDDGSEIYLNVLPYDRFKENPFNIKDRKYPVDYAYPYEEVGTIKFTIPDNFEIVELPKKASVVMPDKSVSFVYSTTAIGKTISVSYIFKVNKNRFIQSEYEMLSIMYEHVIAKQAEPIILKRNE